MRNLRAFVWLRWRLLVNSLRGGRKRDRLEEISRALAMMLPLAIVAMAFGSLIGLVVMGYYGGRALGSATQSVPSTMLIVRGGLFALTLMLVGFAVTSPVQGSLTRYTRLLLLPISRRMLHAIEVAASCADPWIAFLAPGLVALSIGLAVGGRSFAAAWAAVAAVAFLALLAALSACIGFLVAWLLRDRRRSEWFTLAFVVGMSTIGFLPMFYAEQRSEERREARRAGAPRRSMSANDIERSIPGWTVVLPSELYGRAVRAGVDGDGTRAGLAVAGLSVEAGVLFGLSSMIHAQLIGSTTVNSRRRQAGVAHATMRNLPGLSPAVSAVALAQARTMFRSVRGRLTVFMSGPLLAIMVFFFRRFEDVDLMRRLGEYGYLLAAAGSALAVMSAQPITMNLFGSDRAGLTLQFLSPVRDEDLARGKIIGVGLVIAIAMVLSTLAALVVAPGGAPALWIAGQLGAVAVYLILAPVAVWLSALFPVASDLNRTGSAGNPHSLAGLASVLVIAIGLALTGGVFWIVASPLGRPGLVLPVMALWLALVALVSLSLVKVAARTITLRRENLALVAQGK